MFEELSVVLGAYPEPVGVWENFCHKKPCTGSESGSGLDADSATSCIRIRIHFQNTDIQRTALILIPSFSIYVVISVHTVLACKYLDISAQYPLEGKLSQAFPDVPLYGPNGPFTTDNRQKSARVRSFSRPE